MAAAVLFKMDKIEEKVQKMLQKMRDFEAENLKIKEENQRLRNEILGKTVKILELEQDLLLEQTKKQAVTPVVAAPIISSITKIEQHTGGGLLEADFYENNIKIFQSENHSTPKASHQGEEERAPQQAATAQKSAELKAEIDQYIQEIDKCIVWLQQQ